MKSVGVDITPISTRHVPDCIRNGKPFRIQPTRQRGYPFETPAALAETPLAIEAFMVIRKTKDKVLSFRVSDEDAEAFEARLKESGLKKSDYFRQVFIEQKTEINVTHKDVHKLVFYYNKSSNNLNQLAHRANTAFMTNKVDERLYKRVLNALTDIRTLLLRGVENADKS